MHRMRGRQREIKREREREEEDYCQKLSPKNLSRDDLSTVYLAEFNKARSPQDAGLRRRLLVLLILMAEIKSTSTCAVVSAACGRES